jgi:hypothetical protein
MFKQEKGWFVSPRASVPSALLLLLLISLGAVASAQDSASRYFPETRHTVKGNFLK